MKNLVVSAVALLWIVACGQDASEPVANDIAAEKSTVMRSGIQLQNMDPNIRPGDDFFSYVNGTWIENNEIPADKSSFGAGAVLDDKAKENVKLIIEESATGDFVQGSDQQKVGDLYKSYLDLETREARGIEPLRPELARIDALTNHDDLAAYFADVMKRNLDAPFGFGQTEDFKDPTRYIIFVIQSGLSLPDREYYLKDDEDSKTLRTAFTTHIEKMYELAGFTNGAAAAQTVMTLETRLAKENLSKEQSRKWTENYNKVAIEDLATVMPTFNWDAYITASDLPQVDSLVFFSTDYMKAVDSIIANTDMETWKTYLRWKLLDTSAARLTPALDQQNFAFFGTTLSGTQEQQPMWRRGVSVVNGMLGEVVGKVYVKRHFPPEAKERMTTLVGNLVNAYEKSIKALDWMSEATKVEALDKLSKFTPKIGYPDEWRDYTALDIEADDYYGNVERAALAEFERQVDRHHGPVDRTEWGMTPQTVNAYYNPPLNEIVFPAAILQPPFFDLEADDAVNYGGIGAVIGHEIGHGFDDSGSTFDGDGVMRNWWTQEDRSEFEKRTSRLVEQYNAFAPFDDLNVNGEFTLGENIGDLGGISIGLMAYQMSLDGEEAPIIDGFTGEQRVFLGFGQVWRNKYREEALRLRISTDPHSPAMYRTNGPVRNVDAFYEVFDISEDDDLYLPPEERVKIW